MSKDAMQFPSLTFKGHLYPFQQRVVDWMETTEKGILGLEMGLGKTPITICTLCKQNWHKTLVIMPLTLIEQWRKELLKFSNLSDSEIVTYQGKNRKRTVLMHARVVLTTYDVIRMEINQIGSPLWTIKYDALVLDEAHKIRNHKTINYQACFQLAQIIGRKWLLTGTTIHNKFEDFSNLANFLGVPMDDCYGKPELTEKWRKNYYYHLTKVEASIDLPEKTVSRHFLKFKPSHQIVYQEFLDETKEVFEKYEANKTRVNLGDLLVKILRLRQCCNHPDATLNEKLFAIESNRHPEISSEKFECILKIIKRAPADDKLVIFSQWQHSLQLLATYLQQHGIESLVYHGQLSTIERSLVLNEFDQGKKRVLLMTLMSGGVGLNLTCANHSILLDSWWNRATEEQAIDRVYRIGQNKKVEVHRLYMAGSLEHWLIEMKKEKKMVDETFHQANMVYYINQGMLTTVLHTHVK